MNLSKRNISSFSNGEIIFFFVALLTLFFGTLLTPSFILFWCFLFFLTISYLYPQSILYLYLIFFAFTGLDVALGSLPVLGSVQFLSEINAPIIDFLVLGMTPGILRTIYQNRSSLASYLEHVRPMFYWYGGFLLAAWISLHWFMFNNFSEVGIKYLIRPMVFVPLYYFFIPIILVQIFPKLRSYAKTISIVGFFIALFGASSIFFVSHAEVLRFVPHSFFGLFPLGTNHNQLAEALTACIPWAFFLFAYGVHKKHPVSAKIYLVAGTFMSLILLGTLSRAGWLSLLAQGIVSLYFLKELPAVRTFVARNIFLFLLLLAPILAYMGQFLFTSAVVTSSNSARVDATEIAFYHLQESPLFGTGPGSYPYLLADTAFYVMEYGDPLDAHGVIQKILVETGIVGWILFAGFFVSIGMFGISTIRQTNDKALAIALVSLMAGVLVFQLFNTSYYSSVFWLPFGISVGMLSYIRKEPLF